MCNTGFADIRPGATSVDLIIARRDAKAAAFTILGLVAGLQVPMPN